MDSGFSSGFTLMINNYIRKVSDIYIPDNADIITFITSFLTPSVIGLYVFKSEYKELIITFVILSIISITYYNKYKKEVVVKQEKPKIDYTKESKKRFYETFFKKRNINLKEKFNSISKLFINKDQTELKLNLTNEKLENLFLLFKNLIETKTINLLYKDKDLTHITHNLVINSDNINLYFFNKYNEIHFNYINEIITFNFNNSNIFKQDELNEVCIKYNIKIIKDIEELFLKPLNLLKVNTTCKVIHSKGFNNTINYLIEGDFKSRIDNIFKNFYHPELRSIKRFLELYDKKGVNLVLHGHAGTGKTLFASNFTKLFNKTEVYSLSIDDLNINQILKNIMEKIKSSSSDNTKHIIVFDEFDKLIKKIIEKYEVIEKENEINLIQLNLSLETYEKILKQINELKIKTLEQSLTFSTDDVYKQMSLLNNTTSNDNKINNDNKDDNKPDDNNKKIEVKSTTSTSDLVSSIEKLTEMISVNQKQKQKEINIKYDEIKLEKENTIKEINKIKNNTLAQFAKEFYEIFISEIHVLNANGLCVFFIMNDYKIFKSIFNSDQTKILFRKQRIDIIEFMNLTEEQLIKFLSTTYKRDISNEIIETLKENGLVNMSFLERLIRSYPEYNEQEILNNINNECSYLKFIS